MKELSAIEKLEAVKLIMETLGYGLWVMSMEEAFSMFNAFYRTYPHPSQPFCTPLYICIILWGIYVG